MTQPRLLIVEDAVDVADMLQFFFSSHGYDVLLAGDGETALALCRSQLPSLVLLDIGLPDIDGFTVCRRLRQTTRFRFLPVIFASKRDRRADRVEGLALGVDDFIAKPFDLDELFLRVQNALSRSARNNLTDPRTGLPALEVVRQETAKAAARTDLRVIEFKVLHLEAFRGLYSALTASDVLRAVALLLHNLLDEMGQPEAFLGQASEETFTVVCPEAMAGAFTCEAVRRFGADAHQHYSFGVPEGANVRAHDPNHEERIVPMLALAADPPCAG
jgi:DNA-binding response OmpR family regulator